MSTNHLQESQNSLAPEILGRLAQKYGFPSDSALAAHLGVTRQTIGNWRSRGTVDHDLLLRKFPDADLNWLFRGTPAPQGPAEGGKSFLSSLASELRREGLRMTLEPVEPFQGEPIRPET